MAEFRTLVVGVGSLVRRDDAVGHEVTDLIDEMGLPGVTVRAVTQLVPELVEHMASADRVVFVDADVSGVAVAVRRVIARESGPLTHHGEPDALMALAERAGMPVPEVYVVGVPADDFGVGTGLSPGCQAFVDDAVEAVRDLTVPKITSRFLVSQGDGAR